MLAIASTLHGAEPTGHPPHPAIGYHSLNALNPRRRAERDLSAASYERYRRCNDLELTRTGLSRAYAATWSWVLELNRSLSAGHDLADRGRVIGLIDEAVAKATGIGR